MKAEEEAVLIRGVQKLRISVPWKRNGKEEEYWEVDKEKEPFVQELLSVIDVFFNKKSSQGEFIIEISETGLVIIILKNWLQTNEKDSPSLYIRKCQRELWETVLFCFENKGTPNVIVMGSPGIGKSRSLTYLLMLLMQRRKKIIFEARKDSRVFVFYPIDSQAYQVWSGPCSDFNQKGSALLYDEAAIRIVDPGKPDQSIIGSVGHTILCCSPNRDHYKEFAKLSIHTAWFIMPVWSKEELVSLMNVTKFLSDIELDTRYKDFGGRLRYVLSEKHETNYQLMKTAIKGIDSLDRLAHALSPTTEINEQIAPSIVFIYDVLKDSSGKYLYEMTSKSYRLSIGSENARHLLACSYWHMIMDSLNPQSLMHTSHTAAFGRLVELLAGELLEVGGTFNEYTFEEEKDEDVQHWKLSTANNGSSLVLSSAIHLEIYASNDEIFLAQCVNTLKDSKTRILCIPASTSFLSSSEQPVIDFVDSMSRVYQVTIGKKHKVECFKLQRIIKQFNCTKDHPLQFYFLIPEHQKGFRYYFSGDLQYNFTYEQLNTKDNNTLASLTNTTAPKHGNTQQWRQQTIRHYFDEEFKKILRCVKFLGIFIPKNPPQKIEEMIEKIPRK